LFLKQTLFYGKNCHCQNLHIETTKTFYPIFIIRIQILHVC
jgi:hypothetical protein